MEQGIVGAVDICHQAHRMEQLCSSAWFSPRNRSSRCGLSAPIPSRRRPIGLTNALGAERWTHTALVEDHFLTALGAPAASSCNRAPGRILEFVGLWRRGGRASGIARRPLEREGCMTSGDSCCDEFRGNLQNIGTTPAEKLPCDGGRGPARKREAPGEKGNRQAKTRPKRAQSGRHRENAQGGRRTRNRSATPTS